MAESGVTEPFPLWSLLPKRETTAAAFLQKYPEFDGRGIKIAILDSGVDPGAAGLQITSDGKPKIIDMIDATGAGDVDTSTVVEAENGFIKGLTGTQLKIPKDWTNPSGKYHIGVTNVFQLFPKSLRERMAKEYTENEWQPMHKTVTAEAVRQLQEFQSKHSDASADTPSEKLIREDLQSKVEYLKQMDKKFNDLGPAFDCVVFNDGTYWKGVIDTTGVGNLEECTLLGNYRECLKFGTVSERDMYNYSLNIRENGDVLEICAISTSHGTHVASIAAAYFPNEPEKNGVAPGAQIVSCCIGDGRLGSMETGSALIRALIKVIESGCHVINMSYGEAGHYPEGRVLDMIHEVVNKYGVVYVSSAGNRGPALTTVGTPPTMHSSSIIGVGAYVSPDMMSGEYSMRAKMPGMGYSWSSRGPTTNGDLGVSVCAPGGAITSVPNFTLKKAILMNGTSMSSPNVAGCVCLLLSGLKAMNIKYSPFSVRRSIENTALKVQNYEPFTHGHGLIQVEKAFEHLTQFKDTVERDVRFHITSGSNLGIYLRQAKDVLGPSVQPLSIEPVFLDDKLIDSKRKIDFEMNFNLICDKDWVICPPFLNMTYGSRAISIKIDPQALEDGSANFALIKAYDITNHEKGPVFTVPITVIKPIKISETKVLESLGNYKPGYFRRQFLDIPSTVNSMVVRVKNCDPLESGAFVLHSLQLSPHTSCRTNEIEKLFNLAAQAENSCVIQLKSSRTVELCFGKWWSSIGESPVQLTVEFHGLQPILGSMSMMASEVITRFDVRTNSGFEEIAPSVSLKSFNQNLRPIENKVRPLTSIDVIPPGRQIYEILLTYTLQMTKSNEISISCPLLADVLYESEYESQLWMIFDTNKQYLGTGDAYPHHYPVKLEKGDYTIKMQIRHESVPLLEKLTDIPIQIQYKLQTNISLNLYDSYRNAITDGKKFGPQTLRPHTLCPIYVSSVVEMPKGLPISSGTSFTGHMTFAKDENRKKVEQYFFRYIVDSDPQKKPKDSKTEKSSEKSTEKTTEKSSDEYSEALIDLKISWLAKMKGKASEDLFNELSGAHKSNPQLLVNRIHSLDSEEDRTKHLKKQISLANEILEIIKTNELIASMAILKLEKKDNSNSNNSSNNSNNSSKNFEKQKTIVLEALVKKGVAICDLIDAQIEGQGSEKISSSNSVPVVDGSVSADDPSKSPTVEQFYSEADQIYTEISKLIDPYDQKVAKFTERHALLHNHYGRALKVFGKLQENKPTLEVELKAIEAFKKLSWTHLEHSSNRSLNVKYPKNYRFF